jgi:hypothetical protein
MPQRLLAEEVDLDLPTLDDVKLSVVYLFPSLGVMDVTR